MLAASPGKPTTDSATSTGAANVPGGVLAFVLYQRKREAAVDLAVALMQSIPSFLWSLLLIAAFGLLVLPPILLAQSFLPALTMP